MVNVQHMEQSGMITLRCDLSKVPQVASLPMPAVGRIDSQGDRAVAWMSPDEVLVIVPYRDVAACLAQIAVEFQGVHHLAVDVSDARAHFSVTATHGREVLAKLAPVDMHPDSFRPGQFRRSRLGQVAAAFWMQESGAIDLICFRSVSDYVYDLLTKSAKDGPVGHF